jgi:hypothetical protein
VGIVEVDHEEAATSQIPTSHRQARHAFEEAGPQRLSSRFCVPLREQNN